MVSMNLFTSVKCNGSDPAKYKGQRWERVRLERDAWLLSIWAKSSLDMKSEVVIGYGSYRTCAFKAVQERPPVIWP